MTCEPHLVCGLFLKIKFYQNTDILIHLCIGYGCFCVIRTELDS